MKQFDEIVDRYTKELGDLAMDKAIERLRTSKVSVDSVPAPQPAKPAPPKAKAVKAKAPRAPKAAPAPVASAHSADNGNGNGGSGHTDEITVLRAVESLPGRGVSALSKELGVPVKELSATLKGLLKIGTVRTEGQRRGTTYHPAAA
jgi:hypothetical protein